MAMQENTIATIIQEEEFVPWDNYIEMDNIMLENNTISQLLIVANVGKKTAPFFKIQVMFQTDAHTSMIIVKVNTQQSFAEKPSLNLNVLDQEAEQATDIYIVNGM